MVTFLKVWKNVEFFMLRIGVWRKGNYFFCLIYHIILAYNENRKLDILMRLQKYNKDPKLNLSSKQNCHRGGTS